MKRRALLAAAALPLLAGCAATGGGQDRGGSHRRGRLPRVQVERRARGVQFDVCQITLRNRKLTREQFISYSTFVPSGVAEITRLQQHGGFAYLKP